MKTIILCTMTLLTIQAVGNTALPRPILTAPLIETDALGHEIGRAQLTLFASNEGRATLAVFEGEQTLAFSMTEIRLAECGSLQYTAQKESGIRTQMTTMSGPQQVLQVLDHESRICDDYKKFQWDVTLREIGNKVRYFSGTPSKVDPLDPGCPR